MLSRLLEKKAEHIQSLSSDLLIHAVRQNERALTADTSGESKKEMRRRDGGRERKMEREGHLEEAIE